MAVYFIEGAGLIKIGLTSKDTADAVLTRRSALQIGSPVPLTLVAWVTGGVGLEQWLHQELSEWHVRGEWFRSEGGVLELMRFVLGLATNDGDLVRARRWRSKDLSPEPEPAPEPDERLSRFQALARKLQKAKFGP